MNPIIFQSPLLHIRLGEEGEPHSTPFHGWTITEASLVEASWHNGEPYGTYQVTLSCDPPPAVDPGNIYIQGCYLARDLDRAWTFATGLPMSSRGYEVFLHPVNPPSEWQSNGQEVLPSSDWSILQSRLSLGPTHLTCPRWPLRAALRALEAYYNADEVTSQLCLYYFAAMSIADEDLHFLLLAQGLEIARERLDGTDTPSKENNLALEVRTRLRRGLNWLFEVCHRRRQTRHAITKKPVLTLHPPLTDVEERDFLHDAALVLQAVASVSLGLPLVLNDNGLVVEAA